MTLPSLWPHQAEAIASAEGMISHVIRSPTASGKSRIIFELVARSIGAGRTTLLLSGSRAMLAQLDRDAHKFFPPEFVHFAYEPRQCGRHKVSCSCRMFKERGTCICDCGCGRSRSYRPRKLNIESYTRLYNYYDTGVIDPLTTSIFVDECHHSAFSATKGRGSTRLARVLYKHVQAGGQVFGFTATLWRLSREEGFRPIFDTMWDAGPISEFIEKGILADYVGYLPLRGRRWREHAMMGMVVSRRDTIDSFGDYKIEDTEGAPYPVTPEIINLELQESTIAMGLGRIPQTLIYVPRIAMALKTAELLKSEGHRVAMLCSDDRLNEEANQHGIPTDPMAVIQKFLMGEITIIVNVGIVAEGVDFPLTENLIVGIPTLSFVRWYQICGRGLRKDGDKVCRIVDLTGNSLELGWPKEDLIVNSLDHRGNKGQGDEVLKKCDECGAPWGIAKKVCDECGYEFGEPCANCGFWRPWNYYGLYMAQGPEYQGWCDPCIWGEDDYKAGQMQMRERGLFPQFKTVSRDELYETMTVKQGIKWVIEDHGDSPVLVASLAGAKSPPIGFPCMAIAPSENKTYSGVVVASTKQDVAILVAEPETAYQVSEMIR